MSDQIRPHRQQFRPGSEHDVGGHLGLVEDPVVAVEAGPDDGGQQRVDPPGERVENPRPRPMGELVAERLGPGQILHPHQRVVVTAIPDPGPVELAGQPFPAVDVDLDLIGQPRLDADMHEPELGVDQIQVVVHAFPFPADRLQPAGAMIAPHLHRPARLDRRQHAHHPFGDRIPLRDLPSPVLLVRPRRRLVALSRYRYGRPASAANRLALTVSSSVAAVA